MFFFFFYYDMNFFCIYIIYIYVSIFSIIDRFVDKINFNNFKIEKKRERRKWKVGEKMGFIILLLI